MWIQGGANLQELAWLQALALGELLGKRFVTGDEAQDSAADVGLLGPCDEFACIKSRRG